MARWPVPNTQRVAVLSDTDTEGYLEKIAKYVPVEGLTPALGVAVVGKNYPGWLWVLWIVCFLVAVGFVLVGINKRVAGVDPPRWWFWLLFLVSYWVWSVGASEEFRDILNVTTDGGKFALAFGAFAIPGIDVFCEQMSILWKNAHPKSAINPNPAPPL